MPRQALLVGGLSAEDDVMAGFLGSASVGLRSSPTLIIARVATDALPIVIRPKTLPAASRILGAAATMAVAALLAPSRPTLMAAVAAFCT